MRPGRHRMQAMDSGGGKITLDQESFRALASDVRVGILKRLDIRRETVTDLSNLLSLSKPTLLEHLEKLQSAGLVKRIDEGRKWIYYELSDKGRKVLHPERVAITLALAAAVFLAAVGAFYLAFAGGGFFGAAPALNAAPAERTDLGLRTGDTRRPRAAPVSRLRGDRPRPPPLRPAPARSLLRTARHVVSLRRRAHSGKPL